MHLNSFLERFADIVSQRSFSPFARWRRLAGGGQNSLRRPATRFLLVAAFSSCTLLKNPAIFAGTLTLFPNADSYVKSNEPNGNHGSEASLIVNNANGVRVSFLRFDLGGITNPITRVRLNLTVSIPSFANSFDVYGLTNGPLWSETQMVWTNAPGIIGAYSATAGIEGQYVKFSDCYGGAPLASFISTGGAGETDTALNAVSGPALDFAATGTNRQLTFMIVEQDPSDAQGNAWNSRDAGGGQPALTVDYAETLAPVADAYVRCTEPAINHGLDTNIVANNNNGVRVSFLRFDLNSVTNPISRIRLALTASVASPGNAFDIFGLINDNSWDETQLSWSNAPAINNLFAGPAGTQSQWLKLSDLQGGAALATFTTTASAAGEVDTLFDVTNGPVLDFVKQAPGKVFTFVIAERDPVDNPGNAWNSREAPAGQPVLTVYNHAPATPGSPRIIKVYLQGGQSNSDGRAQTNGLPPILAAPQNDVLLYYYLVGGATNQDGSLGTFTTLRPGISALGGGVNFGPELTFGRTLADYYAIANGVSTNDVRIALIKYAHGGTSLVTNWVANGNAGTNAEGPDYLTFQRVVAGGLATLQSAYPDSILELGGMIWVQGESDIDAGVTACTAYGTNLARLISDVRLTFGNYPPYGTNFPFFFTRISTNQTVYSSPLDPDFPNYLLIRAAQALTAFTHSNVFMVDIDGPQFTALTPYAGPGLHFDTLGEQSIGIALANAVHDALPSSRLELPGRVSSGWNLKFTGATGTRQMLDRAPSIAGPWLPLTNIVIGPLGAGNYMDQAPLPGTAFYRLHRP